jgi:adenosylcobinamide-GDP ribazoletransferase
MNVIRSCFIAVSMYSRFPVPRVEWNREAMGYVMCFFPLTGLLEGLCLGAFFWLAGEMSLSLAAAALIGTVIPILITGGIHMDGFMDTMDAVCSYGDREKRLQILKDPHLGAFAVISLAAYLLLYTGLVYECLKRASSCKGSLFCFFPVLFMVTERAFSGISVLLFPSAKNKGTAAGFSQAANRRVSLAALIVWLLAVIGCAWLFWGRRGGFWALGFEMLQLCLFGYYYYKSRSVFGGITGDLAGWFLQLCELGSWFLAVFLFS